MVAAVPQTIGEAEEVVRSTAPKFLKDFSDATMRKRPMFALMKKFGNILHNEGGPVVVWDMMVRDDRPTAVDSNPALSFAPDQRFEQFSIENRKYVHTGMLHKFNELLNSKAGPAKLFDLLNTKTQNLVGDFSKLYCGELYADGVADVLRFHGRGSFLNYKAGMTSMDKVALPDGDYAGQSIELGGLGGSDSDDIPADEQANTDLGSDWPEGKSTADFDATSPLLLNYSSPRWTEDGRTEWKWNARRVLDYANEIQSVRGARQARTGESAPTVATMTAVMKDQFQEGFFQKFRIQVELQDMTDLGFPDTWNYSGNYIMTDAECPARECHIMSPGTMEFSTVTEDFWVIDGPFYVKDELKYKWVLYCLGNFRWQPKMEAWAAPIA